MQREYTGAIAYKSWCAYTFSEHGKTVFATYTAGPDVRPIEIGRSLFHEVQAEHIPEILKCCPLMACLPHDTNRTSIDVPVDLKHKPIILLPHVGEISVGIAIEMLKQGEFNCNWLYAKYQVRELFVNLRLYGFTVRL